MLVLARKVGQSIVIDNNVTVTIKDIGKDTIRIAIDAPKNVSVFRKELIDNVVDSNKDAVAAVNLSAMKSLLKKGKE